MKLQSKHLIDSDPPHAYYAGMLLAQFENYLLPYELQDIPEFPLIMVNYMALKEMFGHVWKKGLWIAQIKDAMDLYERSSKEYCDRAGIRYNGGTSRDFARGYGHHRFAEEHTHNVPRARFNRYHVATLRSILSDQ